MQLKRYIAPARAARQGKQAPTLVPGTLNENGQQVVRRVGHAAEDLPGQVLYLLKCNHCGFEYAEAGIRVHGRKCPSCSEGKPGVSIAESMQGQLFQ